MADVQEPNAGAEPSMEEILASIRRIIADEKDPAAAVSDAPVGEDVLELTQMVQDDGSVVDVTTAEPSEPAPAVAPPPVQVEAPPPAPAPLAPAPSSFDEGDGILSNIAAEAAASSLTALANTIQIERRATVPNGFTPLGDGSRTLEDMVLELMRPMLKAWLDENLPATVDRFVQKEVERIARKVPE